MLKEQEYQQEGQPLSRSSYRSSTATLTLPATSQCEQVPLRLRLRRRFSANDWRLIMIGGDGLLLLATFIVFVVSKQPVESSSRLVTAWEVHLTWIGCATLLWSFTARLTRAYDLNGMSSRLVSPLRALMALLLLSGLWFTLSATLEGRALRTLLITTLAFTVVSAPLIGSWRLLIAQCLHLPPFRRQGVIVGISPIGEAIARELQVAPRRSTIDILGYIVEEEEREDSADRELPLPILGGRATLRRLIEQQAIDVLIMATEYQENPALVQEAITGTHLGVSLVPALCVYENVSGKIPVEKIGEQWYIALPGANLSPLYLCWRKLLDLTFGLAGLLLLLLLLPPLALLIRLDSPGPLFHCQERLGKNGRRFKMYKFRSMRVDAEPEGKARWASQNDARVTRIGRFLRATHLDELPQVVNILRGEMSLIGPRPEREEFVKLLEQTIPFYRCRLSVPPGLTGWAQVKYHYTFTSQHALEKLQYDLYYIKHQSYMLDILILLRTVIEVIKLRGV
ncbi:exopolysaccharide biosynthesis polyprenyl glycosylphosphotransferase [Thermogemmatispora sp.]|uniref:exopolysaccharide biosynthesis polyprenyl glycosylphosphotransferase n=1 Tax=Thermogemmatispora sp. TaxID=1968838 RepID=UPI001E11A29F|nr:exopolysaccharide biosynthesis polyprenyl glycosylphosphotransferase [Thermogemmatispora sp.]MBX5452227.1 exopolysaccharide biosynthesis polyprenyl glycosylphosphotransferase [Thermogemmatispora sp.]